MINVFLKILSMSVTASYCILFVCIARLLLKKAPKIFSYLLWSVVAFRLICPFSFESMFSLVGERFLPNTTYISAEKNIDDAIEHINITQINNTNTADIKEITDKDEIYQNYLETLGENQSAISIEAVPKNNIHNNVLIEQTKNFRIDFLEVSACIWIVVVGILAGYGLITYARLRQKLNIYAHKTSVYHSVNVWQVTGLDTPFVLGFFHPAIYLPENLTETDCTQCLTHEYTHIRRKDYLIKQLAFWLVCIHWFNPLVWLAFYLMTKDMEMSCDEVSLRSTSLEDRKAYSGTLLELSSATRYFNGCPLAFGANSTKDRIKNIMNYKRPRFWVMIMAVILVMVCVVGLSTNPQPQENMTTDVKNVLDEQMVDDNIPVDNGKTSVYVPTEKVVDTKDDVNAIQNPDDVIEVVPIQEQTIADYYDFMLGYRKQYQKMLTAYRENRSLKDALAAQLTALGDTDSVLKAELKLKIEEYEAEMAKQQILLKEMEAIIEMANAPLTDLQLKEQQYRLFAQIHNTEAYDRPVLVCYSYTDIADIYSHKSMPEHIYSSMIKTELYEGDFVEILHFGAVEGASDELTSQYVLICWDPLNQSEKNSGYIKIDYLNFNVPENTTVTHLLVAEEYPVIGKQNMELGTETEYQQILKTYTEYLNNRENNAFVTRLYYGTNVDLDMLLYDGSTMLENVPFAEGELELLARENIDEEDILHHFTGEQINDLLQEKMNLSLADIHYRDGEENTLKSDDSFWVYLEEFDTYTMPAKGDCLLEDIVCTDIKQLYNGGVLISYKSAKSSWIKKGLLYMLPKTNNSQLTSPEDFYFYANRFIEGGYQDAVIYE